MFLPKPEDLKLDPNMYAGQTKQVGNMQLTFGKGENHGKLWVEQVDPNLLQMREMLDQFKKVVLNDTPEVCGQCNYCRPVEYSHGSKRAVIPTCVHEAAPDRNGLPMFLDPHLPPEENSPFCPLLHARLKKRQSFFDLKMLPGRTERKRGQRGYQGVTEGRGK